MVGGFIPLTDPFTATASFMFEGNVGVDLPLTPLFGLTVAGGYLYAPGVMRFDENTILSIENDPVPAVIRHDRTLALFTLFIEPSAYITFHRTQISAGLRLGYVVNAPFTETQEVIDPPGVSFDGEGVIVDAEGSYPGLQPLSVMLTAGVRTMGERIGPLRFEPGVSVAVALTTLSADMPTRQIQAGVNVRIILDPLPQRTHLRDTVFIVDTVYHESAAGPVADVMTITGIDSAMQVIDDVDHTTITIRRELVRTIVVSPSTLLTEVHARFLTQEGRAVDTWKISYEAVTHVVTMDVPSECAVRPSRLLKSTMIDALIDHEQRWDEQCRSILDIMQAAPARTQATSFMWKEETWQPCRVVFELLAMGDVEAASWKLRIVNVNGVALDSIEGSGQPPSQQIYLVSDTVLASVREGAMVRYEFLVVDVDGGRTKPASGTLTFEPFEAEHGRSVHWKMILPWQQMNTSDQAQPWTPSEKQVLMERTILGTFWQRCTLVRVD